MKKAPFKLKSGNKPSVAKMVGISPVKKNKDAGKSKSETYSKDNPHPMTGSLNAKKTKKINFMGNWERINPRK